MRQPSLNLIAASVLLALTASPAMAGTGGKVIIPTGNSISGTGEPTTSISGTGEPTTSISGTGEPTTAVDGNGGVFITTALSGGSGAPSTGGRPSSVLTLGGTGLPQSSVSSHTIRSISGTGEPGNAVFNGIRVLSGSTAIATAVNRPSDIRTRDGEDASKRAAGSSDAMAIIDGSGALGGGLATSVFGAQPAGIIDVNVSDTTNIAIR